MAFLPLPALPHTFPAHTRPRNSAHHLKPRRTSSISTPPLRMCNPPDPPNEISVPLISLKDLTKPPSADPESTLPVDSPTSVQQTVPADDRKDLRSDKQKEIDRLRAAEKFISVDEGNFECTACGFLYEEKKGVRSYGIAPNTPFEQLPDSFVCPQCRSPKSRFVSRKKVIAGFADNQGYGFGSNTMTEGQKSALIFGGLFLCFLLLLSGYALN